MAKTKEQKKETLENLKEKIARQKAMIFVNFKGLKAKSLFDLKQSLKEVNSKFVVAKKTMMKLAFQGKKITADPKQMEGQIALVFGFGDELLSAKTLYNFSQKNKSLEILGGYIESQKNEFLNSEKIITLGQLPTREELLGNLVRIFSAPTSNFVNVLGGNLKGLIYALSAINK